MQKKGVFFSTDALIAVIIIFLVIIVVIPFSDFKRPQTQLHFDVINTLSSIKVEEIDNSAIQSLIAQGIITDLNKTVLEQIGELYVTNITFAEQVAGSILSEIETQENLGLWYGNTLLASINKTPFEGAYNIDTARQTISGIREGQSVTGFSARAFLSSGKQSSFTYFGGYAGDGNLSIISNYNGSINSALLELAINQPFELFINSVSQGNFNPSPSEFEPATYNLSISDFQSGDNIIEFRGDNLHIAGGFLKTSYDTNITYKLPEQYNFPGLEGIINLYDGFYVPGIINFLEAELNFKTNHSIFLNIGNITVFDSDNFSITPGVNQTVYLNNSYLSSILNYNDISEKTVPLRFGTRNLTITPDSLDIAIVSDRSWSTRQSGWTLNTTLNPIAEFNNITVPADSYSPTFTINVPAGTERLAVSLDWSRDPAFPGSEGSEFALNLRGPSGGWIYGSNRPSVGGDVDPPDNTGNANDYFSGISTKPQTVYVENPEAGDWDLRAYGWNLRPKTSPPPSQEVNLSVYLGDSSELIRDPTVLSNEALVDAAQNFINNMPETDRASYVKFGSFAVLAQELTFDKADLNDSIENTGLEGGTAIQTGIESARNELIDNGRENATKIMIIVTDGQNDAGPQIAIDAAQNAKDEDIIIFTIGLTGFVNSEMLETIASSPENFFFTPDASGLENVYDQVAAAIEATYREQTIEVTEGFTDSNLYLGSKIEFNYTSSEEPFGLLVTSEINFTDETQASFTIPQESQVVETRAISYSGPRWTDSLLVNDNQVYNLTDYNLDYVFLGDPYSINIPNFLVQENNVVKLTTGVSPQNTTSGSLSNKIIYTIAKNFSAFSEISATAEGCTWTIQFEDDSTLITPIPSSYSGSSACSYQESSISYDNNDAAQVAVFSLLQDLDFDLNGKIDLLLSEEDFEITLTEIVGIPYEWSTEVQARVWY